MPKDDGACACLRHAVLIRYFTGKHRADYGMASARHLCFPAPGRLLPAPGHVLPEAEKGVAPLRFCVSSIPQASENSLFSIYIWKLELGR